MRAGMRAGILAGILAAILVLAAGSAGAQCISGTTVFNASHDLHKLDNGAVPNMKPNETGIDSAPRLQAAINYMIKTKGCTELVVDQGTYYFETLPTVRPAYAVVLNVAGLTIDLKGSNLIFKESFYSAFFIDGCNSCEFRNFSIDYKHLPFTQLYVSHVDWQEIIAEPLHDWPNPYQLYHHQSEVGGPTSAILSRGFDTRNGTPLYDYTGWELTIALNDQHRIVLDPASKPQRHIEVGDIFIVAARGGGPAIAQRSSTDTTFKDVTIFTSAGPGIVSQYSQGMSFIGIHIRPNLGRLVSTVAGGIELNNITGPNNVVRNCYIEATQDDSIAGYITTANAPAVAVIESLVIAGTRPPPNPVFFLNGQTGATVGGPPDGQQYTLTGPWPTWPGIPPNMYAISPSLTQAQVSALQSNPVIYGWDQFGQQTSVIVQHNTIVGSYLARGIAFSGVSGVQITNNTIDGTQQAGIALGSELPANVPVNNTLIANNKVIRTNMGMSGIGQSMLGAIQIMAYATNGDVMAEPINRKVFVNGNTVTVTRRAGIWIGNVRGGGVDDINTVTEFGLGKGSLGVEDHLNDGLQPYAATAFRQGIVAWCVAGVSGTSFDICPLPAAPAK